MEEKLPCKVHLSGFNCNFVGEQHSTTTGQLLSEPWYSVHREQIERIIYSDLKRRYGQDIKSVEFVCEVSTIFEHMRREMGGHWSSSKWKEAFETYDTSKNGSLDRTEFKHLISQFKITISEQEFRNLWNFMDSEQNGDISYFELVQAFQFDDWKEEEQKDNKMNQMVENLLNQDSSSPMHSINVLQTATNERSSRIGTTTDTSKSNQSDWAHVLATFSTPSAASRAIQDLNGKMIKIRDEVGNVLTNKQCELQEIVPIHRSFVFVDNKEVSLKWKAKYFTGNRPPDLLRSFSNGNVRTAFGKSKIVCEHDKMLAKEMTSMGQVVACNKAIKELPKGDWKRANEILENMISKGVRPWSSSFGVLIDAYLSAHPPQVQRAELVFEVMKKNGVSPSVQTMAAVVRAYGQIGCIDRAERIVRDMELNGPLPNQEVYSALVDAYALHPAKKASHQLITASKVKARHIAGSKRYAALYKALYDFLGPDASLSDLEEQFRLFAGSSGVLDQGTLSNLLSAGGISEASRLVTQNWAEIDSAGRGDINFGQFLHAKEVLLRRTKDLALGVHEEPKAESIVARFARQCSGWVPAYFWRLDSVKGAE